MRRHFIGGLLALFVVAPALAQQQGGGQGTAAGAACGTMTLLNASSMANYAFGATDCALGLTNALASSINVYLPRANSVPVGSTRSVDDVYGGITGGYSITVNVASGSLDVINGGLSSIALLTQSAQLSCVSDGTGKWGCAKTLDPGSTLAARKSLVYVLGCSTQTSNSHTGDTIETVLFSCQVPGGLVAAGSAIRVSAAGSITGNTDTKTYEMRLNTDGAADGTACVNANTSTSSNVTWHLPPQYISIVATGSEVCSAYITPGFGAAPSNAFSINTANPWYVVITGKLGTGTDSISIDAAMVEYLPPGGN